MPSSSAERMESSPSASPAWTVTGKWCSARKSNATRCRDGGKPASAPAMSNPTTPRVAVPQRELRDLERPVRVAHRGDELADADRAAAAPRQLDALVDPALHGLDGAVEAQAGREVLLGRPAHLAVDHAVVDEVEHELAGDALERRARSA